MQFFLSLILLFLYISKRLYAVGREIKPDVRYSARLALYNFKGKLKFSIVLCILQDHVTEFTKERKNLKSK